MSGELVLVSGASGYIGAHCVKKLQEAGYRVRGTVRSLANKDKTGFLYELCPGAAHPVELVEADLLQPDGWPAAVKDCKYVLHTASPFPSENPKNPDEVIKPAVEGTLNVLRAASESGTVKRVVQTSSFAAIENRDASIEGIYSEEHWSVPETQTSVYTRSKTLAERAAWDFIKELPEEKKIELCIINPVLVQGPVLHGNPGTSVEFISLLMEKKMPMIPKFYFPIVDVRDVADAHVKCLTADAAVGQRHVLFSENIFFPDMGKILEKEFKSQGYDIPNRVLWGPVLSFAAIFSGKLRELKNFAAVEKQISNERLRNVLGIEPIKAEKSILEMAHSLIEIGVLKKTDQYRGPSSSAE